MSAGRESRTRNQKFQDALVARRVNEFPGSQYEMMAVDLPYSVGGVGGEIDIGLFDLEDLYMELLWVYPEKKNQGRGTTYSNARGKATGSSQRFSRAFGQTALVESWGYQPRQTGEEIQTFDVENAPVVEGRVLIEDDLDPEQERRLERLGNELLEDDPRNDSLETIRVVENGKR